MVVVITSTGNVTKRVHRFSEPVDPGLANWAAQYANDRIVGLELGELVADGRRRDVEADPLDERPGADRLPGRDVAFDHAAQDLPLALAELDLRFGHLQEF